MQTVAQKVQAGDAWAVGEHGTPGADRSFAASGHPHLPHPATGDLGHRGQRRCSVPQRGHADPTHGRWNWLDNLVFVFKVVGDLENFNVNVP